MPWWHWAKWQKGSLDKSVYLWEHENTRNTIKYSADFTHIGFIHSRIDSCATLGPNIIPAFPTRRQKDLRGQYRQWKARKARKVRLRVPKGWMQERGEYAPRMQIDSPTWTAYVALQWRYSMNRQHVTDWDLLNGNSPISTLNIRKVKLPFFFLFLSMRDTHVYAFSTFEVSQPNRTSSLIVFRMETLENGCYVI